MATIIPVLWSVSICLGAATAEPAAFSTISTNYGKLRGQTISVGTKHVTRFLGVPYAIPPVGELRFRRPLPSAPWAGVRDALTLPSTCYQPNDERYDGKFSGVEVWNVNTEMSEDCLYLNIWVPVQDGVTKASEDIDNPPQDKMAVLIWIHGGSYNTGTSTLDIYDGAILAAEGGLIVASINYRLGPLGFLYLGVDDAPGNAGLLDQQMAIKWLHENIAHFGGDKKLMTLFGQSAGGASISMHLVSPLSRDYIKYAILQSGSIPGYWTYQEPEVAKHRTHQLARVVNCSGDDTDIVACLRKVNPNILIQEQLSVQEYYFDITFGPTADGYFLPDDPWDLLHNGSVKNTSVLLGATKDESTFYMILAYPELFPWHPETDLSDNDCNNILSDIIEPLGCGTAHRYGVINEYIHKVVPHSVSFRDIVSSASGETMFLCPTVEFAASYAEFGNNVFLYHFTHRSSLNPWPNWAGVMHGEEIEFLFGLPLGKSFNYTENEVEFSRRIMQYWTNFAKSGDPNIDPDTMMPSKTWPVFETQSEMYLDLNLRDVAKRESGLCRKECGFWKIVTEKCAKHDCDEAKKGDGTSTDACSKRVPPQT